MPKKLQMILTFLAAVREVLGMYSRLVPNDFAAPVVGFCVADECCQERVSLCIDVLHMLLTEIFFGDNVGT
jgi:hypothetical protein